MPVLRSTIVSYSASKFAIKAFSKLSIRTFKRQSACNDFCPGLLHQNQRRSTCLRRDPTGRNSKMNHRYDGRRLCQTFDYGHKETKNPCYFDTKCKLTVLIIIVSPFVDRLEYNYMKKEPDSPLKNIIF